MPPRQWPFWSFLVITAQLGNIIPINCALQRPISFATTITTLPSSLCGDQLSVDVIQERRYIPCHLCVNYNNEDSDYAMPKMTANDRQSISSKPWFYILFYHLLVSILVIYSMVLQLQ